MKQRMVGLLLLMIIVLSFSACGNGTEDVPDYGTWLKIGDSFDFTDTAQMTGALRCTVNKVHVVDSQETCPPYDWFQGEEWLGVPNQVYHYDQWFSEGGAFDQGCRLLLVDVTVENLNARNIPIDEGGSFDHPYAFYASSFLKLVDMSLVRDEDTDQVYFQPYTMVGFSECGKLATQELEYPRDHYDPFTFCLPEGERQDITLCFPIHLNDDGSRKELSMLGLQVETFETKLQNMIGIKLNLEETL